MPGRATDAILSAAPRDETGVTSGANDSIREARGTIGVAIPGSIPTHVHRDQMTAAASHAPPPLTPPPRGGDPVGRGER